MGMDSDTLIGGLFTALLFLVFFLPFISLVVTSNTILSILVFVVMVSLFILVSYIGWEVDRIKRVVSSLNEDSSGFIASALPLGVIWRLRGLVHEYDSVSAKISEVEEKEVLCRYIQGFDKDMDCGLLEKRRRALENLREAIVAEIRNSLYRGFRENTS